MQKDSKKSLIAFRDILKRIKKSFIIWLILSLTVALVISGAVLFTRLSHRQVREVIELSFDGIEQGKDPSGNKLDIDELRQKSEIEKAAASAGLENCDIDKIYSAITISGDIPEDAVGRIVDHTSLYSSEETEQSQTVRDSYYYPTRYTVTLDSSRLDIEYDDCVKLLDELLDNYTENFYKRYGYKSAIEDMLVSADYSKYEYIDAVNVYDTELVSIGKYINEIKGKDDTRFRSEKSGLTFSDISKYIETIRNEDLGILTSMITGGNVAKNKDDIMSAYIVKTDELKRQNDIYSSELENIESTIKNYQQNTVMLFEGSDLLGADAELKNNSESYKKLIDKKTAVQKQIAENEQKIDMYKNRIESFEDQPSNVTEDDVKKEFEKLNKKISGLLEDVKTTVNEYYENVVLKDACRVISKTSDNFGTAVISSLKNSAAGILAAEAIILGLYIMFCAFMPERIFAVRRISEAKKDDEEGKA